MINLYNKYKHIFAILGFSFSAVLIGLTILYGIFFSIQKFNDKNYYQVEMVSSKLIQKSSLNFDNFHPADSIDLYFNLMKDTINDANKNIKKDPETVEKNEKKIDINKNQKFESTSNKLN